MRMDQTDSGLLVPRQKPEPPPRDKGPLELQWDPHRETAKECFTKLLNIPSGIGGSQPNMAAIEALLWATARLVLGEDADRIEILC